MSSLFGKKPTEDTRTPEQIAAEQSNSANVKDSNTGAMIGEGTTDGHVVDSDTAKTDPIGNPANTILDGDEPGVSSDDSMKAGVLGNDKTGTLAATGLKPDTTAEEAGVDVKPNPVAEVLATQAAANAGVTSESSVDNVVLYSSHPIQNLSFGPYNFVDSVLRLKSSEEAAFKDLIEQLPAGDRATIQRINIDKVDAIAKSRLGSGGTRDFDSSVGRSALETLRKDSPIVGTQALDARGGYASQPGDGNDAVPVRPAVDPQGKTGLDQGPHTPDSAL